MGFFSNLFKKNNKNTNSIEKEVRDSSNSDSPFKVADINMNGFTQMFINKKLVDIFFRNQQSSEFYNIGEKIKQKFSFGKNPEFGKFSLYPESGDNSIMKFGDLLFVDSPVHMPYVSDINGNFLYASKKDEKEGIHDLIRVKSDSYDSLIPTRNILHYNKGIIGFSCSVGMHSFEREIQCVYNGYTNTMQEFLLNGRSDIDDMDFQIENYRYFEQPFQFNVVPLSLSSYSTSVGLNLSEFVKTRFTNEAYYRYKKIYFPMIHVDNPDRPILLLDTKKVEHPGISNGKYSSSEFGNSLSVFDYNILNEYPVETILNEIILDVLYPEKRSSVGGDKSVNSHQFSGSELEEGVFMLLDKKIYKDVHNELNDLNSIPLFGKITNPEVPGHKIIENFPDNISDISGYSSEVGEIDLLNGSHINYTTYVTPEMDDYYEKFQGRFQYYLTMINDSYSSEDIFKIKLGVMNFFNKFEKYQKERRENISNEVF